MIEKKQKKRVLGTLIELICLLSSGLCFVSQPKSTELLYYYFNIALGKLSIYYGINEEDKMSIIQYLIDDIAKQLLKIIDHLILTHTLRLGIFLV